MTFSRERQLDVENLNVPNLDVVEACIRVCKCGERGDSVVFYFGSLTQETLTAAIR